MFSQQRGGHKHGGAAAPLHIPGWDTALGPCCPSAPCSEQKAMDTAGRKWGVLAGFWVFLSSGQAGSRGWAATATPCWSRASPTPKNSDFPPKMLVGCLY